MTRVPPTGMSVGEIRSVRPNFDAELRKLIRIDFEEGEKGEEKTRDTLNSITCIETLEDPFGVDFEAVPYEALVVVGSDFLADTLINRLDRFFLPLAYRRLSFSIDRVPSQDGRISLLFGSLIDTREAPPSGTLRFIPQVSEPEHGPANNMTKSVKQVRWKLGQGRAVYALGPADAADGLPSFRLNEEIADQALTIEPGDHGPRLSMVSMNSSGPAGVAYSALGKGKEAEVSYFPHEGRYEARFPDIEGHVRLIPDSAFSRPLQARDPNRTMLEVRGIFLPQPTQASEVQAISVNFTSDKFLKVDGLRQVATQICLVGQNERLIRDRKGGVKELGRSSNVSDDLGIRILRPSQLPPVPQSFDRRGRELIVAVAGGGPMGWIRLKLGSVIGPDDQKRIVRKVELRYQRQRWIGQNGMEPHETAIYLDWLDTAVRLICRHSDGGTIERGMASHLAGLENGAGSPDTLLYSSRSVRLKRQGSKNVRSLTPGVLFRFGALLVRIVPPEKVS